MVPSNIYPKIRSSQNTGLKPLAWLKFPARLDPEIVFRRNFIASSLDGRKELLDVLANLPWSVFIAESRKRILVVQVFLVQGSDVKR